MGADRIELLLDVTEPSIHGGHDLFQLIHFVGAGNPGVAHVSPALSGIPADQSADSVVSSSLLRRLEGLDGLCPCLVVLHVEGLEVVEHCSRVYVDHVGGLADRDRGQDQMDLASTGAVLDLGVGQDSIVNLEPSLRPTYCKTTPK